MEGRGGYYFVIFVIADFSPKKNEVAIRANAKDNESKLKFL